MKYDLIIYAVNGDSLAGDFQSGDILLPRVLERIRDKGYIVADQQLLEEILRAGLSGKWPDDGTTDPFTALSYLFEVIAERIPIPQFGEFKHMSLLEGTELLTQFTPRDSRIPLPLGTNTLAFVTALANHRMPEVLEEELRKSDPEDPNCCHLRNLILDTIESVESDDLDLYMIVKEN